MCISRKTWSKIGRGRIFDFYATDEEMVQFLRKSLEREESSFSLIWVDLPFYGNVQKRIGRESPIEDLVKLKEIGVRQFFLNSSGSANFLEVDVSAADTSNWSLSGLPIIYQGLGSRGPLNFSSIGIVERIGKIGSDEELHHEEYARIFRKIKSHIKKHLKYRLISKDQDGDFVESKSKLITEGVAELCGVNPNQLGIKIGSQ